MKSATLGALGLAAAMLAGCATSSPHAQAFDDQAPPTAPRGLAAQAAPFESFMRHARGIEAGFTSPAQVARALQTGAAHDPKELESGMVAFAALAALREPRFVAGVNASRYRDDLGPRLVSDPAAVLYLPGAEAAVGRASGALAAQGAALSEEGQKVKHAAYTVQHQAWSKVRVADAAGRLSRVKRLSAESYRPQADDAGQLESAISQSGRRSGPPSAVVERGLALAALTVLGEQGHGRALMSEPRAASCLKMAKLNLFQCLASAGPNYEDIFCLGQHAMIDPGQCVVEATSGGRAEMSRASYRR